jgi:hypothetical protein
MKSIRHFIGARRILASSLAACGLTIGLAAGAPAAHAGPGCTWAPITLVNGWHSEQGAYDTGDPSVCLENDGMVYLSGSVAAPSGSSWEFGVLPVWDWPTHNLYFDVYTMNGTYGILRIDTDGTMYAYNSSGTSSQYTSLAGVSYPDAAITPMDLPLENGWQSADSLYVTGDPAYSITSGVVHLSGSLWRPAGPPPPGNGAPAVLPPQVQPSDKCFYTNTYTYGGGLGDLGIQTPSGDLFDAFNNHYISMAGINYPTAPTAWQQLSLLNGTSPANTCNTGPAYYASGNVVYLTGLMNVPLSGFGNEVAVLPPADRPSHYLYMIAYNVGPGTNGQLAVYVTLRIDPDGSVWIISPPNGSAYLVSLAGLSFHLAS